MGECIHKGLLHTDSHPGWGGAKGPCTFAPPQDHLKPEITGEMNSAGYPGVS